MTLEDAPPKSLGGKATVLTCRKCNNACGHQIDHHLTSKLTELDRKKFMTGVSYKAILENEGVRVFGTISVDEGNNIRVEHDKLKNNPATLEKYLSITGEGKIINIDFGDSKADNFRLQLALLKTGYLLTFAKFGYSFLLDPVYDRLRLQLQKPDQTIYPEDAWFNADELTKYYGTHFITEKKLESIFPIFPLKTELREHAFGIVMPLTTRPIEEVITSFHHRFSEESSFYVKMDPMSGADYLFDLKAIEQMLNRIDKVK